MMTNNDMDKDKIEISRDLWDWIIMRLLENIPEVNSELWEKYFYDSITEEDIIKLMRRNRGDDTN
jgi:hypothetical protein